MNGQLNKLVSSVSPLQFVLDAYKQDEIIELLLTRVS